MRRELRNLFPRSRAHDALKQIRQLAQAARGNTSDADNDFARIERIAATALYPVSGDGATLQDPASRGPGEDSGPDQ